MSYKILTLNDKVIWNKYFSKLPINLQDIYYTPEYYEIYEKNGYGKAQCFVFEKDGDIAIYPFLINSVNKLGYKLDKEYFDIQGAYGLNGPIFNSSNFAFKESYKEEFFKYIAEKNIIAEFTRFNPLIKNERFLKYMEPFFVGKVINVDLNSSEENIWKLKYSRDVRRIIKKGIDNGYQVQSFLLSKADNQDLDNFLEIYHSTLSRNNADNYYYFDKTFFENMKHKIGDNVLFSYVTLAEKPIGASINLFKGINSYGFLGGSYREYQKISPFTFMLHHVILKLKDLGVLNFFLGGGVDSIYKYKSSFDKKGSLDFYIGKYIHNEDVYRNVISQWRKNYPEQTDNKILRYRDIN